ncbi:MAG: hypothetical protein AAF370_10745, partial [Pseudomonadota bacterium]
RKRLEKEKLQLKMQALAFSLNNPIDYRSIRCTRYLLNCKAVQHEFLKRSARQCREAASTTNNGAQCTFSKLSVNANTAKSQR